MKRLRTIPQICFAILLAFPALYSNAQVTANLAVLPSLSVGKTSVIKLKASVDRNAAQISWNSTASIKVRRYELEKSSDGINFSYVTAKPGTSKSPANFSVQDKYLFSDVNYYRIKIIDQKGNYTYSNIASFDRNDMQNEIKIIPSSASENVYVWLPANAMVSKASIKDVTGRNIQDDVAVTNSTNFATIPVSKLTAGIYQVNVVTNTGITTNLRFTKK